jgi:hypothetical protein
VALFRGRRAAILVAAVACATQGGCAIRQDGAGVTRVGIGLWGLGDPPGVDWNLDWPRREIPELPKTPPLELPPVPATRRDDPFPVPRTPIAERASTIDDNPACALRCAPPSSSPAVAAGADARDRAADR